MLRGSHRIAVMGGDGIGPDVVGQALVLLEEVSHLEGFGTELVHFPNSAEHYRRTGIAVDDDTLTSLRSCDSLLFGAAGTDEFPGLMERALVLDLSRQLDLCLGVRPAYLHHSRLTPLKGVERGEIDCVIVRDTTEGALAIPGGSLQYGSPYEATGSLVMHTRRGVERTMRFSFGLAQERRQRLTLVVQSNALVAHEIWSRCMRELADDFPEVQTELVFPDHAAMRAITHPAEFDVIVTTLLIGGILTDLVAGTVGGIGLIASSRINPDTGYGMFEPAHGSAPQYEGQDVVSPLATFSALAMLLDNLGEGGGAKRIRDAIDYALTSGQIPDATTRSGVSTREQTSIVVEALERSHPGERK